MLERISVLRLFGEDCPDSDVPALHLRKFRIDDRIGLSSLPQAFASIRYLKVVLAREDTISARQSCSCRTRALCGFPTGPHWECLRAQAQGYFDRSRA